MSFPTVKEENNHEFAMRQAEGKTGKTAGQKAEGTFLGNILSSASLRGGTSTKAGEARHPGMTTRDRDSFL